MPINITDELHAATTKGKIASAKEVFLTGDTENLQQIGEKTHQLEDSIKNIAATGGASTAAAVTFDNVASGMTAVNAQGAIEELNTKNKAQDTEIAKKANSVDVNSQMQTEQKRVNTELGNKANTADVNTKISKERARVDDELEKKFAKVDIAQELGESENKVVSQKVVNDTISNILKAWYLNFNWNKNKCYLENSTSIASDENYYCSDLVRVLPGNKLVCKNYFRITFADDNKLFVSNSLDNGCVPQGAFYVAFTIRNTQMNDFYAINTDASLTDKIDQRYIEVIEENLNGLIDFVSYPFFKRILKIESNTSPVDITNKVKGLIFKPNTKYELHIEGDGAKKIEINFYNNDVTLQSNTIQINTTVELTTPSVFTKYSVYVTSNKEVGEYSLMIDATLYGGIKNRVKDVESLALKHEKILRRSTIVNNLISDKTIDSDGIRVSNGTEISLDFYGKDNVFYIIDNESSLKTRITFRYRHTSPVISNPNMSNLWGIAAIGQYILYIKTDGVEIVNGYIRNKASLVLRKNNETIAETSLYLKSRNPYNGRNSLYIKYKGNVDSSNYNKYKLVIKDGVVDYMEGDTVVHSVSFNKNESLSSFAKKLLDISQLEVRVINSFEHKVSDLLYYNGMTIPLSGKYATSSGNEKYDAFPCYIPFALNNDWHRIEFVVDEVNGWVAASMDGDTLYKKDETAKLGNLILVGGTSKKTPTPVSLRDLEININHIGDAELIVSNCYGNNFRQLISRYNPRVLIFMGHYLDNAIEDEKKPPYDSIGSITVSTDKLNTLFDMCVGAGYKPIGIRELVEWKIGGKPLPKRCYTIIFDDFQLKNFLDYNFRKPMVSHNIKAGLALAYIYNPESGKITVNEKEYTVEEALRIVKDNGWYICSHVDHRNLNDDSPSQMEALFKNDVLKQDMYGQSEVIVYPFGNRNDTDIAVLQDSGFCIGVLASHGTYLCRNTNNFSIPRMPIDRGSTVTMENIRKEIV